MLNRQKKCLREIIASYFGATCEELCELGGIGEKTLRNDIGIEELAARARMAPNAFLRQFRGITGSTPYQYLLQLRYSYASQLLESQAFSIDEICELVGVKDRFHFSRRFKKLYGAPPALYRRQHTTGI